MKATTLVIIQSVVWPDEGDQMNNGIADEPYIINLQLLRTSYVNYEAESVIVPPQ